MEQDQASEQKKPPFLIYAAVIAVILAAIVWLVLIPQQQEPEPSRQPLTPNVELELEQTSTPSSVENEPVDAVISDDFVPVAEPVEPQPDTTQVTESKEPEAIIFDDAWLLAQILALVPEQSLTEMIIAQDLISNFVVFVDNASRGELVTQFSPVKAPKQSFTVKTVEGDLLSYQLDSASFGRYDKYAALFAALPVEQSLAIYRQLTPAIDQAHVELGYEAGTFDRKLKRAIDFLVDAPVLDQETKLIAPSAMYQYADKELEGLLAIQKLLLRMGPQNQQKIRAKLAQLQPYF